MEVNCMEIPLSWARWFTELCILAAHVVQEPCLVVLIVVHGGAVR